eukprot:s3465_g4.t1
MAYLRRNILLHSVGNLQEVEAKNMGAAETKKTLSKCNMCTALCGHGMHGMHFADQEHLAPLRVHLRKAVVKTSACTWVLRDSRCKRPHALGHSPMQPKKKAAGEAEAFDGILVKLELALSKAGGVQLGTVRLQRWELDVAAHMEAARNLMMAVLQSENEHRTVLQHVFGGDCLRISRARAVVESTLQLGLCSRQGRATDCLRACESVEQVLGDLGLGFSLRSSVSLQIPAASAHVDR